MPHLTVDNWQYFLGAVGVLLGLRFLVHCIRRTF